MKDITVYAYKLKEWRRAAYPEENTSHPAIDLTSFVGETDVESIRPCMLDVIRPKLLS